MKIVADESIDRQITEALREAAHEVHAIAETQPGISDDLVLQIAVDQDALLLTADKDFGELVFRLHKTSTGVALIRLSGLSSDEKATVVAGVFDEHEAELTGAFSVISKTTLRIRQRGSSGGTPLGVQ